MENEDNKHHQVSYLDHKLQKFLSKYNTFIDNLNKNKNALNQIYLLYNELLKIIDSFINEIKEKIEIIFPKENQIKDNYFYSTFKFINESLEKSMNDNRNLLMDLLSNLNSFLKGFKIENYAEFELSLKNIEEDKDKLEIKKKLFQESSKKVESEVLKKLIESFKKNEPFNEALESNDLFKELKINYLDYNLSLENVNKLIEDCNNKQKSILDMYDNFDSKYYEFINHTLDLFYVDQFTRNNLISNIIRKAKEMIILNNKNFLNHKEKKKNSTIYYKHFFDLLNFEKFESNINFLNVENNDEFNRFIFTIELFRKNIGDIYPDINIEKEKERNKIREKIFKLFKQTNNNISEEDKNNLYKLLNKNDYYQKLFLSILNRVRINIKYMKDKELITMIGNALNIIIETSGAKSEYDTVKLCILLSQTFYYEDDKKQKIYALELIKKNRWFHNENFWRNYIDLQIIKEFVKYQDINKERNLNIFMNNNVSDSIAKNINEILFSQLMPHINNMVELNVDKKLIVRVYEEFINKYNYLSQNNIDALYSVISQDKEEMNSLREEAKREKSLMYKNKIMESNDIKGKEEKEKGKENKVEINEIKEHKNEIIEEKNEIKENKNEIIKEKNEIKEIKENKNEIIEEK